MAAQALTAADRGYVLESGRIVRAESCRRAAPGSGAGGCLPGRPGSSGVVATWPSISSCAMPASIGRDDRLLDIGIRDGRIAAIEPALPAADQRSLLDGDLVVPGLVETHIHLDKSCIIDRCRIVEGTLQGGHRRDGARQARLHRGRHRRPRPPHLGEGDPRRHHAHAHARRGRSARRPQGVQRAAPAGARVCLGDRPADLRVSAGGPHQRSRHRGAAGGGLRARAPT